MQSLQINNYELDRLLLRTLAQKDAPRLFEIYSDKEAMKYRGSQAMTSLEDANAFIENQVIENEQSYTLRKGVVIKEEKELIGTVMYKFDKAIVDECVIGYSIGAAYWNRGFGREIVKLLVESIQVQKSINLIKAWTKKENIASSRILELNNFERIEQKEITDAYLYVKKV